MLKKNDKGSQRLLRLLFIIIVISFFILFGYADEIENEIVKIDCSTIPDDFTKFSFQGHDEESRLLNHFLWYHYKTRIQSEPAVYPLEYLTTADMWLGGAIHPVWLDKDPIQEIHRKTLLNIKMSPDGYINTHQHFSHSHEQGWPFPLWIQGYNEQNKSGAVGWHFNHSGPGWMWEMFFKDKPGSPFAREKAIKGWRLHNLKSLGIVNNKWKLEATGLSPALTLPSDVTIDAFNAPYMQLRWNRSSGRKKGILPYVEWMRQGDCEYTKERRVYFGFESGNSEYEKVTGTIHSVITMYSHPLWDGKIKDVRITLAPGEENVDFEIDSFFTVYDTRQTINNPIYILSCWNYFRWTGDIDFLKSRINQMRQVLLFQQTVLGGLKYNHIRNTMPGHDGISGLTLHPDKETTVNYGHGIGSNYWDIVSFGWDDMYATNQYYASTLIMSEVEEAIKENPQWGISASHLAFDSKALRKHAEKIKKVANKKFWDKEKGRFVGCIDKKGHPHDYGFIFLNLDAIWYDLATPQHAKKIMDWITGERIVKTDTSTGEDIYKWRFGPRATTLRNLEWYQFVWYKPDSYPWGGQVQDGGAVLGFTFYDLWARLHVISPDNAWQRLIEILEWEKDVWAEGGYRNYYKDGKQGATLQGGGTAGGIGIDYEFFESSLIPSIVTYGFLGIDPGPNVLKISPKLPKACPGMSMANLIYHNATMDIKVTDKEITITLKSEPSNGINIQFSKDYEGTETDKTDSEFTLSESGVYHFKCN